jgi:hypothetical protein
VQLFHLYTYSTPENPKHINFESYDYYYKNTGNSLIVQKAIDWSNKVDYSSTQSVTPFLNTNKSYSFTYKQDSDYWNTQYFTNYGAVYGSYTEDDTYKYAVNEEKKVGIVFSATPLVNYNNTGRVYPELFKMESNNSRSPVKTNIRLLYYNGLKPSTNYSIGTMTIDNGNYVFAASGISINQYPQVGHIRFDANMNYKSDLNFGLCKQY